MQQTKMNDLELADLSNGKLEHVDKKTDDELEKPSVEKVQNSQEFSTLSQVLESAVAKIGWVQILLCIALSLSKMPIAWFQLSTIFMSPAPRNFTCSLSLELNESLQCDSGCLKYKYDSPIFNKSIVVEWDLICDRKWLNDFTQTIFMLGSLLGSIIFGIFSDRFGRRKPLIVALIMQTSIGLTASYSWDWYSYTILRFFVAVSNGGLLLITFVITMEIIGVKYRHIFGILYHIPFIIGHATLPGVAYLTRNSWSNLEFWISLPTVVFFGYYFFIPESPRWLMTKGRLNEAASVIKRISTDDQIKEMTVDKLADKLKSANIVDVRDESNLLHLFRMKKLRTYTILLCLCWFSSGISFFGVSQYVGRLGGDIFLNVAISGIIQIPGTLFAVPSNRYFGRKKMLCASLALIGVFLAIIPAFQNNAFTLGCSFIVLLGVSVAFPTVYMYSGEIFPTVVRNSGMGLLTMLSRIGAMVAPQIASLKIAWLPPVVFGAISLTAAGAVLFLPETQSKDLPDTVKQAEDA